MLRKLTSSRRPRFGIAARYPRRSARAATECPSLGRYRSEPIIGIACHAGPITPGGVHQIGATVRPSAGRRSAAQNVPTALLDARLRWGPRVRSVLGSRRAGSLAENDGSRTSGPYRSLRLASADHDAQNGGTEYCADRQGEERRTSGADAT